MTVIQTTFTNDKVILIMGKTTATLKEAQHNPFPQKPTPRDKLLLNLTKDQLFEELIASQYTCRIKSTCLNETYVEHMANLTPLN